MSFAVPLVLVALTAVPVLVWWYIAHQSRRQAAATAFVRPQLAASLVPRAPGWRRHAPMVAFALAVTVLIIAAARPQSSASVPVDYGAVMLANDVSSSMASTDVEPSRLGAAIRADQAFLAHVPHSVEVGLLRFTDMATVLQPPTTDHQLVDRALAGLHAYGHTAIGSAMELALGILRGLRTGTGKPIPGALVLLSDGGSDVGVSPLAVARQAAADHIPVYTIALGTAHGTIPVYKDKRLVRVPVPLQPSELRQIASLSEGKSYTADDAPAVSAVYRHLASQLGHKKVEREMTAGFTGAGLVLLLVGSVLSLRWFGRLV